MRETRRREGYRSAVLLGVVAGMRSQLPLALLARGIERVERPLSSRTGASNRLLRRGLLLSAVGEFVGDKLPVTPSRLDPSPLAGRVVLGAVAGTITARRRALPGRRAR